MEIQPRQPGLVLVFSMISCGFYLIWWYYKIYEEVELLTGETPTGHSFIMDFILNLITCSIYGIWVDYQISQKFKEMEAERGVPFPNDTGVLVVVLDLSAYITGIFTNIVSSAIHQDQLNKIVQKGYLEQVAGQQQRPGA